ncbi:META domain-containing protein [Streptomyces sp. NBC_00055]|uniref:META domain-containing protein n=1 Tax=unclassified Streptomyces TaxID=2593676 RepID=UPI00386A541D
MTVSVLALLTLAACGTESGSDDGSGTVRTDRPVTGVHWNVDSVTVGGKRTVAPDGAHVTITPDGRATGNFGCNHFTAPVRVDGDTVTVKPATTTEMGCEKDLQRFERALSRTFSGRLTAAAAEKSLTLTTAKGDSIAFTSEPAAPLVGTTWTVTALVSGSAASSLPAGAGKKAQLRFGEDDSVQGSPGCNRIRGTATVSGSAITFGRINGTRTMCPDPQMKVERALLAILDGRTTYRIDHRTLTLTTADGEGFSATAAAPGK